MNEKYSGGPLLIERLHALGRTQWSTESLAEWARPWVALLSSNVHPERPGTLPPHFIDCTPFNCVAGPQDELIYIDAEWSADGPIPLSWVFIRGPAYSLGDVLQPALQVFDRRTLVKELGRRLGIPLTDADFHLAEEWGKSFQAYCRPLLSDRPVLAEMLDLPAGGNIFLFDALNRANGEIEQMKNSRSWRITQPLRSALDVLRKVRKTLKRARD